MGANWPIDQRAQDLADEAARRGRKLAEDEPKEDKGKLAKLLASKKKS